MAGFATFEPAPAPLSGPAVPTYCFRLAGGKRESLPNVLCLSVERRIGANAGQARFRYLFSDNGDPDWPSSSEEVLAPKASGRYIVSPDDRILVYVELSTGDQFILFDGFAQIPTGKTDSTREGVEFLALATPVRCWDKPCWGRLERDATFPMNVKNNSTWDLPIVFNPDGLACMTDDGADGGLPRDETITTPIFLDVLTCKSRKIGRLASLAMAVRYLLTTGNDEKYVDNGDIEKKTNLLNGIKPTDKADVGTFDPQDSSTIKTGPIIIREYDATGIAWPDAVEHLLTMYGFQMIFRLVDDGGDSGPPNWEVNFIRVMDNTKSTYRKVYLQTEGDVLDPALTNVLAMQLSRDRASIANEYAVEAAMRRYEASFVLAPEFIPLEADAANPTQFDDVDNAAMNNGPEDNTGLDDYRTYVFDECGDGHFDFKTNAYVDNKGTSLAKILASNGTDDLAWVRRRRPGRRQLFTLDEYGKPRPSLLLLSTDYKGPIPGVWDGTGTWYEVGETWRLLEDRLGIRLTAKSVEGWNTGNKGLRFGVNLISSGGIVKGVSAQALGNETHFHLMLTTVIEGDKVLEAVAAKRPASPTKFAIRRYVDAKERYKLDTIAKKSWWNFTPGSDPIVARDDTDNALFDATQKRSAHEIPSLVGTITLARFALAYSIGHRITKVEGRGLSLQTNAGVQGEPPMYPLVVGITWDFDGKQTTTLHLSDQRVQNVG